MKVISLRFFGQAGFVLVAGSLTWLARKFVSKKVQRTSERAKDALALLARSLCVFGASPGLSGTGWPNGARRGTDSAAAKAATCDNRARR